MIVATVTAVFFINCYNHDSMQATITPGNSPSIRASRALRSVNVRRMCVRALALARRNPLTLAVISAIATYTGVLIGNDPLTYASAFVALGFICLADSSRKGGDK